MIAIKLMNDALLLKKDKQNETFYFCGTEEYPSIRPDLVRSTYGTRAVPFTSRGPSRRFASTAFRKILKPP